MPKLLSIPVALYDQILQQKIQCCILQVHVHVFCAVFTQFAALPSTQQMSLQSLEGTVAALSFTDDLQRWHKQLQTIEAVLSTWLKVQLLWVQLEEVCPHN